MFASRELRQRYLQADVLVQEVPGKTGGEYLLTDQEGAWYGVWIRSFHGDRPELTGYLVEVRGKCAELAGNHLAYAEPVAAAERQCRYDTYFEYGIRAYRVIEGQPPEDVTASIAPDPAVIRLYEAQYKAIGASPVIDDHHNLDQVPVLRWVVGFDPENTSASQNPPIFDGGHYAHAGFIVWNGKSFERRNTVPRALWPCRAEGQPAPCPPRTVDGDPFVTD